MLERLLVTSACLLGVLGPAWGQGFLPAPAAVRIVADGQPWTGRRPGGETVRLTLRPDGSGRFEGPLTREATWSVQEDAICIAFGFPLGTKCVRFLRQGAELVAHEGSEIAFILSR